MVRNQISPRRMCTTTPYCNQATHIPYSLGVVLFPLENFRNFDTRVQTVQFFIYLQLILRKKYNQYEFCNDVPTTYSSLYL